jgi:hypothetical protein
MTKRKVEDAFVTEMMSSEESEEEEEDGSKSVSFTIRPLPWRNERLQNCSLTKSTPRNNQRRAHK